MSEYQYYEFQAVDRPLSKSEQAELRALSTRARITSTSFVNEYHWGNFKGDPLRLMERYFDGFVYVANWGTRKLMLRLPTTMLKQQTVEPYCAKGSLEVDATDDHVIVDFSSELEAPELEEDGNGEGWLPSLISIRQDLASGDLRALYLGWLNGAQSSAFDDDLPEPPVPPGLGEPSGSLDALADFLRIDEHLLATAAEGSPSLIVSQPSRAKLASWIRALPEPDKDDVLIQLAEGTAIQARAELLARFRRESNASTPDKDARARTVGELLARAEERRDAAERERAIQNDRARARLERAAAASREVRLDGLVGREDELWQEAEESVVTKSSAGYDRALRAILDLHGLSVRSDSFEDFDERLRALRERHSRKTGMLRRLKDAGLDGR